MLLDMVTMNLKIDDELFARLREHARKLGCSVEEAAIDMLAAMSGDEIELTPEQEQAVQEGMEQLDRGERVTEAEMRAQLKALRR